MTLLVRGGGVSMSHQPCYSSFLSDGYLRLYSNRTLTDYSLVMKLAGKENCMEDENAIVCVLPQPTSKEDIFTPDLASELAKIIEEFYQQGYMANQIFPALLYIIASRVPEQNHYADELVWVAAQYGYAEWALNRLVFNENVPPSIKLQTIQYIHQCFGCFNLYVSAHGYDIHEDELEETFADFKSPKSEESKLLDRYMDAYSDDEYFKARELARQIVKHSVLVDLANYLWVADVDGAGLLLKEAISHARNI